MSHQPTPPSQTARNDKRDERAEKAGESLAHNQSLPDARETIQNLRDQQTMELQRQSLSPEQSIGQLTPSPVGQGITLPERNKDNDVAATPSRTLSNNKNS